MVAADLRWLSMKLPPSFFFATSDAAIHELDEELTTSNYSTTQCSRKIALSSNFMNTILSQFGIMYFFDIYPQFQIHDDMIKFTISQVISTV